MVTVVSAGSRGFKDERAGMVMVHVTRKEYGAYRVMTVFARMRRFIEKKVGCGVA